MINYLFLDIDGVLNSERTLFAYKKFTLATHAKVNNTLDTKFEPLFDPISVKLLQSAQQLCNFKIVISSSWRIILSVQEFHLLFDRYNWDTRDIIVGKTGNCNNIRGQQIENWLNDHASMPYNYVIIDDSDDMLPKQMSNFVKTDISNGMSFDNYRKIIQIFGYNYEDALYKQ